MSRKKQLTMNRERCSFLTLICLAAFWAPAALWAPAAFGGLSAENIVVVVNEDSQESRTIANHYIDLRNIPSLNVILLPDVPQGLVVDVKEFQDKILKPVLAQLDQRKLSSQARVIAYSAGFPTTVQVKPHLESLTDPTALKYQLPMASLTGATYYYRFVLAGNGSYLNFTSNLYARSKFERTFENPLIGDAREEFEAAKKLDDDGDFKTSADKWLELFKKHPTQAPMAIRAAEAFAKSDRLDEAEKALALSLRAGWWSRTYLEKREEFAPILERPNAKRVLELLDPLPHSMQGPVEFRADQGWGRNGYLLKPDSGGIPYMMSCSLAVIHKRGSTLEQAIEVLKRASSADATFPQGRFSFSGHPEVRSQTRYPNVPDALVYLKTLKHETEIFRSDQPTDEGSIMGLMTGRPTITFDSQPWTLQKGSIGDNLTSFGGVFNHDGHTKLTEFLHAGAAMSCGPVAEPYSIQEKFPLPMMYGYYARGMSSIESFYLSIACPYQTLIVGDPLASPFSRAPAELVDFSLKTDGEKRLVVKRRALGMKIKSAAATAAVDVALDGRIVRRTPPAENVEVKLPQELSGSIEVRATLVGLDRTTPRHSHIQNLDLQGPHPSPVATIIRGRNGKPASSEESGDVSTKEAGEAIGNQIVISVSCPGADSIHLSQYGKSIATVVGQKGTITIDAEPLGDGPLRFRPSAKFGGVLVFGKSIVDRM